MIKHIVQLCVVGLLSFNSVLLNASTKLFDEGSRYFEQGEYAKAIVSFKRQELQGDKSVSLYYNLASTYFKLGDYQKSRFYFEKLLADSKMRGLAQYNIGLIEMKLGHTRLAADHFNQIVDNTTNPKLKQLAKQQLKEVKRLGNNWNASAAFHLGYDDNITSAPTETALDESDSFYDLYLYVDRVVSGHRNQGWIVEASYFTIDFNSSDNYDEYLYSAGVRYEEKRDDWKFRYRLAIDKNYFADEDYQTSLKLEFTGRYKLSKFTRLGFRYRYQDISSDRTIFDYLEGTRHRFRVDYNVYAKNYLIHFYYELEHNDRGILNTINYAYDYSPVRNTLYGKYTYVIDKKWDLVSQLQYRMSDFPSSASFNRDDEQLKLAVGADYRVDKSLKFNSKLQYIDNQSSVQQYDYDKLMLMFGLSKLF